MNLIGKPWIPVVYPDGASGLVGLDEIYEKAGEIRDLAVSPPQRVALMRLLICITQAALDGPADEEEWRKCRELIVSASRTYLKQRGDKFDLFGKTPFLQAPNLVPTNNALIDKLDFGLAPASGSVLFDHSACAEGREHSRAWIALMLLTYQSFCTAGLIKGQDWAKVGSPDSGPAGPCAESSLLHCLLRGRDLLETLWINLLTRDQIRTLPGGLWGTPIWENTPDSAKDPTAHELTSSYLGRLVPMSRAVLLTPMSSTMTLARGLAYEKLPLKRDTMATVVMMKDKEKEIPRYLSVKLERHPWRDLQSVLILQKGGLAGGPMTLQRAENLGISNLDIWTGGLTTVLQKPNKVRDTAEWTFNLPVHMIGDLELSRYQKGVELAQQGEKALGLATGAYCKEMKITSTGGTRQKTNWINRAKFAYWGKLDTRYEELIQAACGENTNLENWRKHLFREMYEAFRATCPHETPRQIKAYTLGESKLRLRRLDSN